MPVNGATDPLSPSTARHFRKIFWKVNCLVMQTVHLPEAGAVGKWDFLSRLIGELCFWMKYQKSPSIFRGNFFGHFRNVRYAESGDDKVVDVDTRIIAATNRNLRQMVIDHEFRQDLLYRLDVLKVYIPPLRERTADILPLFSYFLNKYNNKFGKDIAGLTPEAQKMLRNYHFEGNIRELRNIAERVSVMCEHDTIDKHLMETALYPEDVFSSSERKRTDNDSVLHEENTISPNVSIEEEQIREALRKTGGKKTRAAELLGMDRSTLWRKNEILSYRISWHKNCFYFFIEAISLSEKNLQ